MSDIIFKTMLLKGEAGNNIGTIQKTATAGLVDTYTITLTDGSTTSFEVTNGSNITSVEKTATSGLIDTYTITLTNGDTFNFSVTNGERADGLALWENGETSTRVYVAGNHLVWLGDYYRVIDDIAIGDALVVDENIEDALVGTEVETLERRTTTLENNLTANNESLNFSYDSTKQKYGFIINNKFYSIGGSGMPTLDYSNPLHTFSTGNLTYTASDDCYLLGQLPNTALNISINGVIVGGAISESSAGSGSSETTTFRFNMSQPILKLSAGDVVVLSATAPNIHIFAEK